MLPIGIPASFYHIADKSDSSTLLGAQVTQIHASSEWCGLPFLCIFPSLSSSTPCSCIHPTSIGAAWQAWHFQLLVYLRDVLLAHFENH